MKEVRYKGATIYVTRYSGGDFEAYVHDSYIASKPRFTSKSESEVVGKCKAAIDEYLKKVGKTEFSADINHDVVKEMGAAPVSRKNAFEWALRKSQNMGGTTYDDDSGIDYFVCEFETDADARSFLGLAERTGYFKRCDQHGRSVYCYLQPNAKMADGAPAEQKLGKVVYSGLRYDIQKAGEQFVIVVGNEQKGGYFNTQNAAIAQAEKWLQEKKLSTAGVELATFNYETAAAELLAEARKRKTTIAALFEDPDFAHYKPYKAQILEAMKKQRLSDGDMTDEGTTGTPGKKTPEEMEQNPEAVVNSDAVKEMGADPEARMSLSAAIVDFLANNDEGNTPGVVAYLVEEFGLKDQDAKALLGEYERKFRSAAAPAEKDVQALVQKYVHMSRMAAPVFPQIPNALKELTSLCDAAARQVATKYDGIKFDTTVEVNRNAEIAVLAGVRWE